MEIGLTSDKVMASLSLSDLRLNVSCGNQVQSHHILLLMFLQVNCYRYFCIQMIYAIVVWNFINTCLLVFLFEDDTNMLLVEVVCDIC